jgi:drug/metabolite transporter (DMT)-like permease
VNGDASAPKKKLDWRVPAAWLTLCVVWSSTWLAIKWGLEDLPPVSFAGIRFVVAVVALLAFSIVVRAQLLPRNAADWKLLAVTGVMMFAVNYGLLFWGELHVSSGLAAVLQTGIPIFGLFFAHWLLPEEPIVWRKLLGSIAGIGGVVLICFRLLEFHGILSLLGGIGIVLGGASAALANVMLKRRKMQFSPGMIAAWQMIFGAIPLLLFGVIFEGNPFAFKWTPLALGCLLYLAVIGSALTFLLLYWLMPRMSVINLQTISLITPPGAIALGWWLGGERFSTTMLLGAGLVLLGVAVIFWRTEPKPITPKEEEEEEEKLAVPRG